MRLLQEFGVCDCHSHVYGPYDRFPLSDGRTFTPPESPIGDLEAVWLDLGIDRAVLIQGSAHGEDLRALLDALSRAPEQRRGIALLPTSVTDLELSKLHSAGVRGIRFNWLRHLSQDPLEESAALADAAQLLARVSPLGWHAEIHVEIENLEWVRRLDVPQGMAIVIDHMARPDVASADHQSQLQSLMGLLRNEFIWLKLSGADRATSRSGELHYALPWMRALVREAADRCVWGLDWPHVNLAKHAADGELARLLLSVTDDACALRKILIRNPERLYGFSAQPKQDGG